MPRAENRMALPPRNGIACAGSNESRRHDEGERRIPTSKDIEETQHLCGLRHTRDQETEAKDHAAEEAGDCEHASVPQAMAGNRNDEHRGGHENSGRNNRSFGKPGNTANAVPRRTAPAKPGTEADQKARSRDHEPASR